MIKRVAVVSPVNLLEKYSTDFHIVLTQYYLNSKAYRDFYLERRAAGDFIILDNGAAELKAAMDNFYIQEVWSDLQPSIVVAPDTIYNKYLTITDTMNFLAQWSEKLHDKGIRIMAVPQGTDAKEWFECYKVFNAEPRIDWLGISMFYTPKFSKRSKALELIAPTVHKPCHLLGLWNNPYDLLEDREFNFVMSIDTAKSVEFALEGLTLADWAKHRHIDDDWYFLTNHLSTSLMTKNVDDYVRLFKEGKDGSNNKT